MNSEWDAAVAALARQLDVPEEILRTPLSILTPQERAERDAALLRDVDAAYAEVARAIGPRLIAEVGLDPERYELVYERDGCDSGGA